MKHESAKKLARTLLEVFGVERQFVFEVDTPENAAIVAAELRVLGMLAESHPHSQRIDIAPPGSHRRPLDELEC